MPCNGRGQIARKTITATREKRVLKIEGTQKVALVTRVGIQPVDIASRARIADEVVARHQAVGQILVLEAAPVSRIAITTSLDPVVDG